jgi:hypothetical protein
MLTLPVHALVLITFAGTVAPPEPAELVLRTTHSDDGATFKTAITPEQAKRVPAWEPDERQPPPLSMDLAIKLARDSVRLRHPQFDEYRAWSVDMARIGWSYTDRWYYVVTFRAIDDGAPVLSTGFFAAVLMDGTVIEPERLPPPSGPKMD